MQRRVEGHLGASEVGGLTARECLDQGMAFVLTAEGEIGDGVGRDAVFGDEKDLAR